MNKSMNTLIVLVSFIAGLIGCHVGSVSAHGGDMDVF
jgi:hypothetical protein